MIFFASLPLGRAEKCATEKTRASVQAPRDRPDANTDLRAIGGPRRELREDYGPQTGPEMARNISKMAQFEMGQNGPKPSRVARKSPGWPKIPTVWPGGPQKWPDRPLGGPIWAANPGPGHGCTRVFWGLGFLAPDSGAHFESFPKNFFLWAGFVTPNPKNPKLGKTLLTSRVTHFCKKKLGRSLVKFWDKLTQILSIRLGSFSFWDIIA